MKSRTKRGRPKLDRPQNDRGTPELIAKRQAGLTTEPLDLCLERKVITREQHWAGIHLRWLYTVIFGAPTVSASDPAAIGGRTLREDNTAWLRAREVEYTQANTVLHRLKAVPLIPNVCIFNRYPHFLIRTQHTKEIQKALQYSEEYGRFTEGLEGLYKLFSRQGR